MPQFPQRDLTNQYISLSYQDVVQRWLTGSVSYFLDGYGNVIGWIDSGSLGNQIITTGDTASFAVSASWAPPVTSPSASYASFAVTAAYAMNGGSGGPSSSYAGHASTADSASYASFASIAGVADVAFLADTASVSAMADVATSASWASRSFSASYAIKASNADTASWAPQNQDITVNSITASSISASGEVIVPYPRNSDDAATKGYVDHVNPQGLEAFFRADVSDIAGYYQMHDLSYPLSASSRIISQSNVSASQNVFVFASDAIGVTAVEGGNYLVHFQAWFTGGGAAALSVVPEFWLLSGSVEFFVASDVAVVLDKTVGHVYDSIITVTASFATDPLDRAIVKFRASSQNQTPTMLMAVDGQTSAGIIIPVPASNFVLKAGDRMTGPLTNSFGFNGTSSWAVSASWAPDNPNAVSASYAGQSLSSSYALEAANADVAMFAVSAVSALTASEVTILPTNGSQSMYIPFVSGTNAQQLYIDTGSVTYTPSSDLLFATNMSASAITSSFGFYGTASNAVSTSYARSSSYADTCSFFSFINITQSFITSASWASQSLSADSSSWSSASLSSSFALASHLADTASFALNATPSVSSSWASSSLSSSLSQTASYVKYSSTVVIVTNGTTSSLLSLDKTTYNSIFVNYFLNDTTNFRAGSITVLYNTSSAALSEICTTDLGDSSNLQFSTSVDNTNVNLLALNGSANDYSVKYHYDVM